MNYIVISNGLGHFGENGYDFNACNNICVMLML